MLYIRRSYIYVHNILQIMQWMNRVTVSPYGKGSIIVVSTGIFYFETRIIETVKEKDLPITLII